MQAETPLRIASVTKTFVAASILRLYESEQINLDDPIANLISTEHTEMLEADGYATDEITVRQLLMHASGMNDHFASDTFTQTVMANPAKKWTRTEQLAIMLDTSEPIAAPGEAFHYSDTGYILLGEIIERTLEKPLGESVRSLLKLESLGLQEAYWEGEKSQDADAPNRAHQFLAGFDTYHIDGSADAFGGGGIIASVEEVARFYHALARQEVFEDSTTLATLLHAPGHPLGSPYRMGVFADSLEGIELFRHSGFWGIEAVFSPELDLTIVGAVLEQSETPALKTTINKIIEQRRKAHTSYLPNE